MRAIEDKVIKTELINWRQIEWLQGNLKQITQEKFDKLKANIVKNGFKAPFYVWEDNGTRWILDGHHRKKILEQLEKDGFVVPDKLPANFIKCRDIQEAAESVLHYASIFATIHDEGLYEFQHSFGLDIENLKFEIDLPNFDMPRYEAGYVRDDLDDAALDEVPEPPKEQKARYGDLYLLGKHKLMCGDAEKKEDVEKLLDGKYPNLVFIDPPYGINIVKTVGASDGGSKPVTIEKGSLRAKNPYPFGGVKNKTGTDGSRNWVDANDYYPIKGDDKPFNPNFIHNIFNCHKIMWGGNYYASKLPDSSCWLVWDKNNTGNFADCELAWTSFKQGIRLYRHTWNGLVREGSRDLELPGRMHPTQKPVGLFMNILKDFSNEDEIVWDGYGGSGSTLIACEKTNRTCYMMEIEPVYIDIIIERYENLTGKKAELIERISGQTLPNKFGEHF